MRTSLLSSSSRYRGRAAAYTAFGWVLVFLAWHVVWVVTGLKVPSAAEHHGSARVVVQVFGVVVLLMTAVGVVLPLALAQSWGRRIPRRILLTLAWSGCALLGVRGLAGVGDDLVRASGLLPNGLTGMTTAQVTGSAHPSTWAVVAAVATDVLFVLGGLAFGWAALSRSRDDREGVHNADRRRPVDDLDGVGSVRQAGLVVDDLL
jgi:hypothetical protein